MALKIYNTLTRGKEEFIPLNPPQVKIYVCGITPYDESHLGHARAYVTFDLISRTLEYFGYQVFRVQNITDIDDKIISKAAILPTRLEDKLESSSLKEKCRAIVEKYSQSYFAAMDQLRVKRADLYPKATEHIPEMIAWISGLLSKGIAYQLTDGVYFAVDQFTDYGKLSGRRLGEMEAGSRVEVKSEKRNPFDFALWKLAKPGEPAWDSPWGAGRPGWHIECSVMSTKYLGEQFDIHGGGLDLEFPHHENELAQTEALTGKKPWVKYWVHNGFVNVNKQKMSKSLGNFFTLPDVFRKFDPQAVRLFILATHYRSPINYSDQELKAATEGLGRLRQFIEDVQYLLTKASESAPVIEIEDLTEELEQYRQKFSAALEDDFNSAGALGALYELIRFYRQALDKGEVERECLELMQKSVEEFGQVLGLELKTAIPTLMEDKIKELIAEREAARKRKDYLRADQIRDQLLEEGIVLVDTPTGVRWKARS